MALFLDVKEKIYLKKLLNGQYPGEFWVKNKILEKLDVDNERTEKISECEHEFFEWTEERTMCKKCGCFEEGMGFSRGFGEKVDPKDFKLKRGGLFD